MINIDLEKAEFLRNADNTYDVRESIGSEKYLHFPRVSIRLTAEPLPDESLGGTWELIDRSKEQDRKNKITVLFGKIRDRMKKHKKFFDSKRICDDSDQCESLKTCTMCGKDFDLWDEQEGFSTERRIGYGSKYDGEELQFDFCCDCFDRIVDRISPLCIKPLITNSNEYPIHSDKNNNTEVFGHE